MTSLTQNQTSLSHTIKPLSLTHTHNIKPLSLTHTIKPLTYQRKPLTHTQSNLPCVYETFSFLCLLCPSGSLFLFKGSHYWKFAHPGSSPEEGFPRPVASDWLNCPDPSPLHPGDISLTSIVGQQELQEREEEGALEQIRRRSKTTTRHTENHGECPCSNSASPPNTSLHFPMIILLLHTLTYQPSVSLFTTCSHPVRL